MKNFAGPPEPSLELLSLVAAVCEGAMTPEQWNRLNKLLAADADARAHYIQFLDEYAELLWRYRKDEDAFANPAFAEPEIGMDEWGGNGEDVGLPSETWMAESVPPRPAPTLPVPHTSFFLPDTPLGGFLISYSASAVVLGIVLLIFSMMASPAHRAAPMVVHQDAPMNAPAARQAPKPEPAVVSVGRITGMVDCVWVNTEDVPFHDRVVLGTKYMLKSGLMEITYYTRATVILQGPCTYTAESAAGGFLSLGKLTARVEKKRGGEGKRGRLANSTSPANPVSSSTPHLPLSPSPPLFSVRTPTAVVTDLGTEFGVEVDKSGAVETQVLDGMVQVATLPQAGIAGASREVRRGEAVRVTAKGTTIQRVAAQSQRYVRQFPRPHVIRDDFRATHNYLTEGTSGSIWHGILNAKNASRLDTQPHPIDGVEHSGRLIIAVPEGAYVGWSQPERGHFFKNAPYLYINIPKGDFDARVRVESLTKVDWSICGLMARLSDNNFIMVNRNRFSTTDERCSTRSEQAGEDANACSYDKQISGECCLRLTREGDAFRAYYSVAGNENWWIPLPWGNDSMVLRRSDLKDAMQVGLWYGTFSSTAGSVAFDNFSVQGNAVHSVKQKKE